MDLLLFDYEDFMRDKINIHSTATVNKNAKIGSFTAIWHYSHVERDAEIGENCNLGQNCYVGNNAVVGNGCRLGNSVSIFSNVLLEDYVFCAPFMVFTHIAFPRALVCRHDIFEKTIVRRGATLGANCTITPGVVIEEGAFIGGGAVITKDCKAWGLYVGVPAKHVGWVSALGEKINLPLHGTGEWNCQKTGDNYILTDDNLERNAGLEDVLCYVPGKPLKRMEILGD